MLGFSSGGIFPKKKKQKKQIYMKYEMKKFGI